jgi:hypothetical protein
MLSPFFGLRIVESAAMVERVMHARSPARAKRRMARGFPQHHITRPMRVAHQIDTHTLVMHPIMARELREAVRNA